MTGTLTHPARALLAREPGRRWNRRTQPSPWVGCPECGATTVEQGAGGRWYRLLPGASGDGARCATHSRTLEQRQAETDAAMRWIVGRWVSAAWPGDIS